jgi:abortive infection bacteriophage resistance protein
LVYELSISYGPQWFEDTSLISNYSHHQTNIFDIDKEIGRSEEEFIKHHRRKYGMSNGRPPAWKAFEVLALGTLSKIYSNLKDTLPEKNIIAKSLALPNHLWLQSWMLSISVLRNNCAHHCRIWNAFFNYPPKKLVRGFKPWIKQLPENEKVTQLVYNQLCIVKYLLNVINPGNHFTSKLKGLITKYSIYNIKAMGFTNNWEAEPLWQN